MPEILHRVRRFIRQHALLRSDTRVVCALSGGSDSVALARLLHELHRRGDVQFVGIVHLNHQLRAAAAADERFCADLARRLDRPIFIECEDIAGRAARDRMSVEGAAHDARYALYARARAHFAADVVALGHTRDDQAETFLLRLLRGAGPRGLASIRPRHGHIVRPLLDSSRAELREWLEAIGADFVDDESNADVSIPRNRIRHELLPRLAVDFNPNIVEVLAREADLARDLWEWLLDELKTQNLELGTENVELEPQTAEPATRNPLPIALDLDALRAAPRALRRLALWRALERAGGTRRVGAVHIDAVLALVDAADGACVDVPGIRVHRIGARIVLTKRGSLDSGNPTNYWKFPLSIPGEVTAGRVTLSAELVEPGAARLAGIDLGANVGKGPIAAVRADLLRVGPPPGLAVRNRRPGDSFRPVGLGGRKKLQDAFVDRKIVRGERDSVPIVVDDSDRIVWVAGHGIDEAFRVTDASQSVVVLKLRYLERCS